jgi:hypothetical protein
MLFGGPKVACKACGRKGPVGTRGRFDAVTRPLWLPGGNRCFQCIVCGHIFCFVCLLTFSLRHETELRACPDGWKGYRFLLDLYGPPESRERRPQVLAWALFEGCATCPDCGADGVCCFSPE